MNSITAAMARCLPRNPIRARPCVPRNTRACSVTSSTSVNPSSTSVDTNVWFDSFWEAAMSRVDRPSARSLLPRLAISDPLGVDVSQKGISVSKNSLYAFTSAVKLENPRKIVLVRVGEFFEAWGFDAGLNPMGSGVPRAGFPVGNLRRSLADLTSAGFSVVVCEEINDAGRTRNRRKERYVAQIVTPASPDYVHNLHAEDISPDYGSAKVQPIIGIGNSSRGLVLMSVDLDLRQCRMEDALTQEAVVARLQAGGFSVPIYLHDSASELDLESVISTITENNISKYSGNMQQRLFQAINCDVGLSPDAPFTVTESMQTERPRPLYMSTAKQLGIVRSPGIPSLCDFVLPPNAHSLCKRYIEALILSPPPREVALAIQRASIGLRETSSGLPEFQCIQPGKIVRLLNTNEANHFVFRDLWAMLSAVVLFLESHALEPVIENLLKACEHETGNQNLDNETLLGDCQLILQKIDNVVVLDDSEEETQKQLLKEVNYADARPNNNIGAPIIYLEQELNSMFIYNEKFRGRVRCNRLIGEMKAIDHAKSALITAVENSFASTLRESAKVEKSIRFNIVFSPRDNSLWLKGGSERPSHFFNPRDRNGSIVRDRWSTNEVEDALAQYRTTVSDAEAAVSRELKKLSSNLQPFLREIVTACTLSIITKALVAHVEEGSLRRWSFPTLQRTGKSLAAYNLFPYWMDKLSPQTQLNSFNIDGMILLTGPNMAGKSTICRSACALALLGNCGLMVPSESAFVPFYDAFLVKMGSSDSPVEKLSSFAVEMLDVRTVLRDCTQSSFAVLDELGRGTEVKSGAAIAGAVLERLDKIGTTGIFCTHMYELLDMHLRGEKLARHAMEVEFDESGQGYPTWRMVPGESRRSLALETARRCDVDEDILTRAAELIEEATDPLKLEPDEQVPLTNEARSDSKFSLGDAANLLKRVAATAGSEMSDDAYLDVTVTTIGPGQMPPPRAFAGAACVYIYRSPDGSFYCGETDNLGIRIKQHRKSLKQAEFIYILVNGKSLARAIETFTIKEMLAVGFPMSSVSDRGHRTFGIPYLDP